MRISGVAVVGAAAIARPAGRSLLQLSRIPSHVDQGPPGIKRFCQSEECGLPFYDLNRADIACPNCGSVYVPPPVIEITAETFRRVSAGGRRPGRTMLQLRPACERRAHCRRGC